MRVSHLIKEGIVLFPKIGAEDVVRQIVNLGTEKHDHLCDAFTLLVREIIDWSAEHRGEIGMALADMNKVSPITSYADLHKGTPEQQKEFYRLMKETQDRIDHFLNM